MSAQFHFAVCRGQYWPETVDVGFTFPGTKPFAFLNVPVRPTRDTLLEPLRDDIDLAESVSFAAPKQTQFCELVTLDFGHEQYKGDPYGATRAVNAWIQKNPGRRIISAVPHLGSVMIMWEVVQSVVKVA